jgi:hypothetical protein
VYLLTQGLQFVVQLHLRTALWLRDCLVGCQCRAGFLEQATQVYILDIAIGSNLQSQTTMSESVSESVSE